MNKHCQATFSTCTVCNPKPKVSDPMDLFIKIGAALVILMVPLWIFLAIQDGTSEKSRNEEYGNPPVKKMTDRAISGIPIIIPVRRDP